MNTEDLFKYGVTPKEGKYAGKRFIVDMINKFVVFCHNETTPKEEFTHGSYDLWQEPKTLFEDDRIAATWRNLKKAVEKAGLGDDTEFAIDDMVEIRRAKMRVGNLRDHSGEKRIFIIVR